MQYRHVLAAVDLAEDADFVFQHAQETAVAHGAKLSVIAVLRPTVAIQQSVAVTSTVRPEGLDRDAEEAARERLRDLVNRVATGPVEAYVRMGAPALVVRDLAVELDVDLIVLGTNGRQGLGLLLGSTAFGVLHSVGCDVLTLRIRDQAA